MIQPPDWVTNDPFCRRLAFADYLASLRGGQVLSVRAAARRWQWSKGQAQRFIDRLKAEGLDQVVEPEVVGTAAGPGLPQAQPELFPSEQAEVGTGNGRVFWPAGSRLKRNDRRERIYPEEFIRIWELFPGKGNKLTSYNHVRKEVNAGVPVDRIIEGVEAYAEQVEDRESQYIRAAHNFFGASQWEDALAEAADYQPQYGERTGEFYR